MFIKKDNNIAIIFAGGIGQRANNNTKDIPKQFVKVNKKPILVHTLEVFNSHPDIDKIYISILADYKEHTEQLIKEYELEKVSSIIEGGKTAQDSIYCGLRMALSENTSKSIVLIHDGVRPIVTHKVISENINSVKQTGNAITCVPSSETILILKKGGKQIETPVRKDTYKAQAPQSFILGEIIKVHQKVRSRPNGYKDMVDSATLYRSENLDIFLVEGNTGNIKVTYPEDIYRLEAYLNYLKQ